MMGGSEFRPKLSEITLGRRQRRVLHGLGCALIVTSAVSLATYFMVWHTVRDSGLGAALTCSMLPDCDPAVVAPAGPGRPCTGLDHSGPVGIILICVVLVATPLMLVRARWPQVLVLAILDMLVCMGRLVSVPFLSHLLENVSHLWPGHVFIASTLASLLIAWIMVFAAPCLFVLARRRLERPS